MGFTDLTPYKLTLDFKKNELKTLVITQYDKDARTILVTCTDNGVKKVINNTTTSAKVKWMKPDNNPVFNICPVNTDGTITINISEQMSLVDGEVTANLMLLEATTSSVLHTMSFRVVVQKGVFSNDTITSTPEFQALTQTLTDVEACTTVVNGHIANVSNPHNVLKAQIGLGNADNTSDSNKPLSTIAKTDMGTAYNPSIPYGLGEYCIYSDVLYICTTAIPSAEEWNVSHWTSTNIMNEIHNTIANIDNHKISEATESILGHVKLSSATDITDSTGLALPVTEKNQAVSGSLASDIALRASISKMFYPNNEYGGIISSNFDTTNMSGFYTGYGTATGAPNSTYSWFLYHHNSNAGTVSAYQRAVAYSTTLIVYERTKIASVWGAWKNIMGTTDISAIADGTVTGGISTLNSANNTVNTVTSTVGTVTGGYVVIGKVVTVSVKITLTSEVILNSTDIIDGLPTPYASLDCPISTYDANSGTSFLGYVKTYSNSIRSGSSFTTGTILAFSGSYIKA